MMIEGLPSDPWSAAGAGITGLILGVLWLRTKLSKDNAAIAGDRAEVDMINRLTEENRELRTSLNEVTQERNKLYREVGELVGSVKALEASQKQMETRIQQLTEEVNGLRQALQRAGHERRSQQ